MVALRGADRLEETDDRRDLGLLERVVLVRLLHDREGVAAEDDSDPVTAEAAEDRGQLGREDAAADDRVGRDVVTRDA